MSPLSHHEEGQYSKFNILFMYFNCPKLKMLRHFTTSSVQSMALHIPWSAPKPYGQNRCTWSPPLRAQPTIHIHPRRKHSWLPDTQICAFGVQRSKLSRITNLWLTLPSPQMARTRNRGCDTEGERRFCLKLEDEWQATTTCIQSQKP